ncbi:hypothetical protein EWB00_000592 [Schistosoma japonicum]|uniref:Secreted protein n=1 Tax=Schistosoma japonicum TaxID=6182 RepID=A0A4Z2DID9_SCHJA|nr:hypothetical protein EWB00_000592 [Schistosoma japonicum]
MVHHRRILVLIFMNSHAYSWMCSHTTNQFDQVKLIFQANFTFCETRSFSNAAVNNDFIMLHYVRFANVAYI